MLTIHKLTAGDGYTYLTRQVAGGDIPRAKGQSAADYYTQAGTPPGTWAGRGLHLLGLETGSRVTEQQMGALFGDGVRPDAETVKEDWIAAHHHDGMTKAQTKALVAEAERKAGLGKKFASYKKQPAYRKRVSERLGKIAEETGRSPTDAEIAVVKREEARTRAAVAGFDLVFAPVKSAALLWGLHPDERVRRQVKAAHDAAIDAAMEMVEKHAAFTRKGTGGVAQIETNGLIYARFDHHDSRAGDPNLHTHIPVLNKVQGVDGKWRSLDARALYAITVAASEYYNTRFETELSTRLGVDFDPRPGANRRDRPVREVTGISPELVTHFSRRRIDLEARYRQLITAYRADHGRDPDASTCHKLARQATLDTRPDKPEARSLQQMRREWTAEAVAEFGTDILDQIEASVPADPTDPAHTEELSPAEIDGYAADIITNVAEERSTWTRWNIRAEAERFLRQEIRFPTAEAHQVAVDAVVEAACSPVHAVRIDATAMVSEPASLRRSDGESVFAQHGAGRYSSALILDAENRLLAAARQPTGHAFHSGFVGSVLDGFEAMTGTELDGGQRHMVTAFTGNDALMAVGLGPAGSGKTTTMNAYQTVLHQAGRRLIPLATSANAAAVLGQDLNTQAETVHKFLWEHYDGDYANNLGWNIDVPPWARRFQVLPGDVILVDEAGMAGTLRLDKLTKIAAHHGAQVRLLGDYRQLGAIESGGALRLIASDVGATELVTIHRFTDPATAHATLALARGDSAGLDHFEQRGLVRGGSADAMRDHAYTAWKRDMEAGRTSVLIAATNDDVTALNARARTDRVQARHVKPKGFELHDGNEAGVGDWIVTRQNHRGLRYRSGRDFVRNGTMWKVLKHLPQGGLRVQELNKKGRSYRVDLPGDYVRAHVELGYATTVHRVQGATVDTAHALITPEMGREHLHVATTRARDTTTLYTVTHHLLPTSEDDQLDEARFDPKHTTPRQVLERVLERDTAELSATETIRESQNDAVSLSTLAPRYQYALETATSTHYTQLLQQTLPTIDADTVIADGIRPVQKALLEAETVGWKPEQILTIAAAQGPLTDPDIDSPAAVLSWRINTLRENHPAPAPLTQPTASDAKRYARLLRTHLGFRVNPDTALTPPDQSISGIRIADSITPTQLDTWAKHLADNLDTDVESVTAHRSWPVLATALTRAHHTGHDPRKLLDTATNTNRENNEHHGAAGDPVSRVARTVRHLIKQHPTDNWPVTLPLPVRCHQSAIRVLGPKLADEVRTDAAWPAITAALRRSEQLSHTPDVVLKRALAQRSIRGVDNPAQILAWRINRHNHLATTRTRPEPTETWRAIAWTLKTYETTGGKPGDLLRQLRGVRSLDDVLEHTQHTTRQSTHDTNHGGPQLPWIHQPAGLLDNPTIPDDDRTYLTELAGAINTRSQHLLQIAEEDQPSWLATMGETPSNPKAAETWRETIRLIAAYRDQQQVTSTNPFGSYPEEHRSGHHAYWHTLTQLLTTANPTPPAETINNEIQHQIQRDIATHTWTTLNPAQKAEVLAHLKESTNTQIPAEVNTNMLTTTPATTTALLKALTHQGRALWTPHQPQARRTTEDENPFAEQPHHPRQRDASPKTLDAGSNPLRRPAPTINVDIQPRQRLLSGVPLHALLGPGLRGMPLVGRQASSSRSACSASSSSQTPHTRIPSPSSERPQQTRTQKGAQPGPRPATSPRRTRLRPTPNLAHPAQTLRQPPPRHQHHPRHHHTHPHRMKQAHGCANKAILYR